MDGIHSRSWLMAGADSAARVPCRRRFCLPRRICPCEFLSKPGIVSGRSSLVLILGQRERGRQDGVVAVTRRKGRG